MAAPAVFPCGGYSSGWARASLIILRNCLLGLGRAVAVVESACAGWSPVAAASGMVGPNNRPTATTVPTEAPATVLANFLRTCSLLAALGAGRSGAQWEEAGAPLSDAGRRPGIPARTRLPVAPPSSRSPQRVRSGLRPPVPG